MLPNLLLVSLSKTVESIVEQKDVPAKAEDTLLFSLLSCCVEVKKRPRRRQGERQKTIGFQ